MIKFKKNLLKTNKRYKIKRNKPFLQMQNYCEK